MRQKFYLMSGLIASFAGSVCWAQVPAADISVDRVSLQALKNMRDPFKRLGQDNPDPTLDKPKPELETVPVSEFKMVGVLTGPNRTRALVRAPSGSVYPVSDGTRIGVQNGYVRKVLRDRIIVNEILQDVIGEKELVTSELRLNSKGVQKGVSSVKAITLSESGGDGASSAASSAASDDTFTQTRKRKQDSTNATGGAATSSVAPAAVPAPTASSSPKASAVPSATTYGGSNFTASVPPPLAAPSTISGGGQTPNPTQQTAGSK